MREKTLTAEQVAQAIFQAQDPAMLPYDQEFILEFVQDLGLKTVFLHLEKIKGLLSYGRTPQEITEELKTL